VLFNRPLEELLQAAAAHRGGGGRILARQLADVAFDMLPGDLGQLAGAARSGQVGAEVLSDVRLRGGTIRSSMAYLELTIDM
jgi:hypothetical protein